MMEFFVIYNILCNSVVILKIQTTLYPIKKTDFLSIQQDRLFMGLVCRKIHSIINLHSLLLFWIEQDLKIHCYDIIHVLISIWLV